MTKRNAALDQLAIPPIFVCLSLCMCMYVSMNSEMQIPIIKCNKKNIMRMIQNATITNNYLRL